MTETKLYMIYLTPVTVNVQRHPWSYKLAVIPRNEKLSSMSNDRMKNLASECIVAISCIRFSFNQFLASTKDRLLNRKFEMGFTLIVARSALSVALRSVYSYFHYLTTPV